MDCTSAAVNAEFTSFFGSTFIACRKMLAIQFSDTTSGCTTTESTNSGPASSSTALSAIDTEMFFGTISPKVTCRKVTISSASRNAIVPASRLGEAHELQRHHEEVVDGRFGDVQDQQRAHGDAQLADREHDGDRFHGLQRADGALVPGVGQRLDLASGAPT